MLYLQCDWLVYNQYVNRGHELTIFINPILTLYLNYTGRALLWGPESHYYREVIAASLAEGEIDKKSESRSELY